MTECKGIRGRAVSLAVYALVFLAAFLCAGYVHDFAAAGCLALLALGEYFYYYRESGRLLQMEGVFALFWTGGVSLACLKLSKLSQHWEKTTWLCFAGVYIFFVIGYEASGYFVSARAKRNGNKEKHSPAHFQALSQKDMADRILKVIYAVLIISVICFCVEAAFCEIPLFSDKPHAYSYFHISGVHYFTVTGIFGLPLAVIYKNIKGRLSRPEWIRLIILCAVSLSIPVLCVSRFQLMLAVFLSVCVELCMEPKVKLRYLIGVIMLLVPAYVLVTVARNHDVSYLNSIFEMKNAATPIFITQPYMYVANNFDNFNCLVTGLTEHTLGLRQLFPLFALTGLKFIFPQLVSFPLYITKTELTTVTLIYDAFYDFGVIGVFGFGLILGAVCALVTEKTKGKQNPVAFLFYGQIVMYLVFSFFTTWYSNPTTWFWLAVTGIIYFVTGWKPVTKEKQKLTGEKQ